jgi:hypothetical protein
VAGLAHLVLNDEDSSANGFTARYHVANEPLLAVAYEHVYIGFDSDKFVGVRAGAQFSRRRSGVGGLRH